MISLRNLFPAMIDLTVVGSIAIVFVLVARLFLRKAPKIFSYALWAIVLVRLLIPMSIPSPISAVPDLPEASNADLNAALPRLEYETPQDRQENVQNLEQFAQTGGAYVHTSHVVKPSVYVPMIWLAGVIGMTAYSIISYSRIRKKIQISVPLRENIYLADDIRSPFVIGLFRPRIYLPDNLTEGEQSYIILHEQHHIRRFDHWFKALAFLALTVHWFNPLVWLAFILSARDMEMSCDEAVIRKVGESVRADYSASLLTLATGRRIIAGTPLAFGEGDTRGRIRNLANWRRPAFWVILIALILCVALAVCLLTDPLDPQSTDAGITYYSGIVQDYAMAKVNETDWEGRSYITILCYDGEERLFWFAQGCVHPEGPIVGEYVLLRTSTERTTGLPVVSSIEFVKPDLQESLYDSIQTAILAHHGGKYLPGQCRTAHFKLLSQISEESVETKEIEQITVYGIVYYQEYDLTDGVLKDVSGAVIPTVLTFAVNSENQMTLSEYWEPRDGTDYSTDIKSKFKGHPYPDTSQYLAEQELNCYLQAAAHFDVGMDTVVHSILTDMVDRSRWHVGFGEQMEACNVHRGMLSALGADTLKFCFNRFLQGGNEMLYGQIMAYVCSDIMEDMGETPLKNWSFQQSGQDWFRAIKNQARELIQNGVDLRISHPGTYLLVSMDESVLNDPDWGLTITSENITPTGMTLAVTQSGGMVNGELITGQPYFLQKYESGEWVPLEPLLEAWSWTMEAWLIPINDTVRWNVDWEWLYGTLKPGHYRFGKNISCSSAPGVYQEAVYYAEFHIGN